MTTVSSKKIELPSDVGSVIETSLTDAGRVSNRPEKSASQSQVNGKPKPTATATAMVEVPVFTESDGFAVRVITFRLSLTEAKKVKRLKEALHQSGATFNDGRIVRHVDRGQDVLRWILAQVEIS